jgi:putative ABC transport system permease protein
MMFGRVLWQLLRVSRGRLAVALVALVSGAAVCSALLNLQLDAKRKLTQEFRALGANVVVAPPQAPGAEAAQAPLMDASVWEKVAAARTPEVVAAAPYLYIVARATGNQSVVVVGTWLDEARRLSPWWKLEGEWIVSRDDLGRCLVGSEVARQLHLAPGSSLDLRSAGRTAILRVVGVVTAGGGEDNQVLVNLPVAQRLSGLENRIGVVQLSVAGAAGEIERFVTQLAAAVPDAEVRPVRQLAEAEAQLLGRIRRLILWTVVLILVLTGLGVLATMAALAMERRRDVGLMKALGGTIQRVVRLFLAEVGILGGLGGLLGYGIGVLLSEWMGERVFGTGISPRWEVLPVTLILAIGVALAGALPLRLLGRVRPAAILRGE